MPQTTKIIWVRAICHAQKYRHAAVHAQVLYAYLKTAEQPRRHGSIFPKVEPNLGVRNLNEALKNTACSAAEEAQTSVYENLKSVKQLRISESIDLRKICALCQ